MYEIAHIGDVTVHSQGQAHTAQTEETRVWCRQRVCGEGAGVAGAAGGPGVPGGLGGPGAGRWQNVHTHRSQMRLALMSSAAGACAAAAPSTTAPFLGLLHAP